jgi:hypothetical protein
MKNTYNVDDRCATCEKTQLAVVGVGIYAGARKRGERKKKERKKEKKTAARFGARGGDTGKKKKKKEAEKVEIAHLLAPAALDAEMVRIDGRFPSLLALMGGFCANELGNAAPVTLV